jgi:ribosome biogenesis GTPase
VRVALDPARLAAWHKLRRELEWVDDRRSASRAREARGRRHELNRRQRS